jgi:ribosomal-protein-alanine N-acetyltransferase
VSASDRVFAEDDLMNNPTLLETERLILRPFTWADLEDLYCQLSDEEVMSYYPAPLSREESKQWLKGILRDYESEGFGMLAVHLKGNGEYVGQVGVMRRLVKGSQHHFLSYLIQRKFWKQGYAAEAVNRILDYGFQTLGIKRIEALVKPGNIPSIRLAERLGMHRESCVDHGGCKHYVYALASRRNGRSTLGNR